MKLLTAVFLNAYPGRILNVHPALLPSFPGLNVQKKALEYGVRFSGATVHFVDAGVDTGPSSSRPRCRWRRTTRPRAWPTGF